jgi:hypothetical protein
MFARILTIALLVTAGFVAVPSVQAATLVDTDIVADTTWTREMSPIQIKGRDKGQTILRVANGAALTIEPGVQVMFDAYMTLEITGQCLRSYNSDECIRDRTTDQVKRPKLIAIGTQSEPIIFTSLADREGLTPRAGDWGGLTIESDGSTLDWVQLLYGGRSGKRAFLEINDTTVQNTLIAHSETTAVRISRGKLLGNIIRNHTGDGVLCLGECDIESNLITEVGGDAIQAGDLQKLELTGNLIYKNGGYGVKSESNLVWPLTIIGNFFFENKGGIEISLVGGEPVITQNNFLKNKEFALRALRSNDTRKRYTTPANWYGIDSGATQAAGEYFVSPDFDTGGYARDGYDFEIPAEYLAGRSYRQYLTGLDSGEALYEATVTRTAIAGSESRPGSLLRTILTVKNLSTKATDFQLRFELPRDQELLLCSVSTTESGYSLESACESDLPAGFTAKGRLIFWEAGELGALRETTLVFVSVIKPYNFTDTAQPAFFGIKADKAWLPIEYTYGETTQVLAENAKTKIGKTRVMNPNTKADKTLGALERGTVVRQMVNGTLQYVLQAESGKNYLLFNKEKWRELDDFTKSADKHKKIGVFGEYYKNYKGQVIGISFTRFEVE